MSKWSDDPANKAQSTALAKRVAAAYVAANPRKPRFEEMREMSNFAN